MFDHGLMVDPPQKMELTIRYVLYPPCEHVCKDLQNYQRIFRGTSPTLSRLVIFRPHWPSQRGVRQRCCSSNGSRPVRPEDISTAHRNRHGGTECPKNEDRGGGWFGRTGQIPRRYPLKHETQMKTYKIFHQTGMNLVPDRATVKGTSG